MLTKPQPLLRRPLSARAALSSKASKSSKAGKSGKSGTNQVQQVQIGHLASAAGAGAMGAGTSSSNTSATQLVSGCCLSADPGSGACLISSCSVCVCVSACTVVRVKQVHWRMSNASKASRLAYESETPAVAAPASVRLRQCLSFCALVKQVTRDLLVQKHKY